MWFNNIIVYQLQTPFAISPETMHNALEELRLKPCPPHARLSQGWINPFNFLDEKLYSINNCHIVVAASEVRLLPASVIRTVLDEKLIAFEQSQQRPMRRAEQLQLKEEIEFDLLPKAFTVQKKDWLYIDTFKQWVVINNANPNKASDIMALLIKALGSISAVPLTVEVSLSHLFSGWLKEHHSLPESLSLGRRCVLIKSQDDKSQYICKDIEQNGNEIDILLEEGYCVASLELSWQDRIQFVLTDSFQLKRLKCIDYLEEAFKENSKLGDEHEKFDANFSLLAGEVRELISFLIRICQQTGAAATTTTKQAILSEN
ncbi:MAG: hypothetical protein A3F46_05295 [Legionellales bacterium RIFCSPHIGHO2_12_FULL_42_9]|nr:MAG: hypothetical protein A3F46_05295 [Legionellales bacterium RIFCSPHIGHO2_12_FULL_42_9]